MASDDPISVLIGGRAWLCPPMPFYCLERAWPHIQRLGQLGGLSKQLADAELQVRMALGEQEIATAQGNLAQAERLVAEADAGFIGQTREALAIVAAALTLDPEAPSYDSLAKQMRPSEFQGIHDACAQLLDSSGLIARERVPGEAWATSPTPALLNGHGSSPN